jgi:predicted membrane protein
MATRISYSRGGIYGGALILAVGLILLLDQMGYVSAAYIFRFFWPAIFIFFGTELAVCRNNPSRRLIGIVLVCFGVLLLFGSLGILRVGLYTMWPVLLIVWGVWVMVRAFGAGDDWKFRIRGVINDKFHKATGTETPSEFAEELKSKIRDNIKVNIENNVKSKFQSNWSSSTENDSVDSEFDYMAIFGGIKQRIAVKNFRGGRLLAVCGGFEIDLTRADIEGQSAVIDASALMGGGEIRVPETWIVEIRAVALLGGYTDETHQMIPDSATAKHLIVKGIAALGGVVIKN